MTLRDKLLNQGWVKKSFRLREEYLLVCAYLEFKSKKINISNHELYNSIFNFSIDYLNTNSNNQYIIEKYDKKRNVKGFMIKKETQDRFNDLFDKMKEVLVKDTDEEIYIGELVEFIIYIYCFKSKNFSNNDFAMVGEINWGIMDK